MVQWCLDAYTKLDQWIPFLLQNLGIQSNWKPWQYDCWPEDDSGRLKRMKETSRASKCGMFTSGGNLARRTTYENTEWESSERSPRMKVSKVLATDRNACKLQLKPRPKACMCWTGCWFHMLMFVSLFLLHQCCK